MKSARLYTSRIPTRKTKVHVIGPEVVSCKIKGRKIGKLFRILVKPRSGKSPRRKEELTTGWSKMRKGRKEGGSSSAFFPLSPFPLVFSSFPYYLTSSPFGT